MNTQIEFILLLIKKLMNPQLSEECGAPYASGIDFYELKQELMDQNMLSTLYLPMFSMRSAAKIPDDILKKIKDFAFSSELSSLLARKDLAAVLQTAENGNITVALVKGPVLSSLYPEPLARHSGDFDILIGPEGEEKIKPILSGAGYKFYEEEDSVFVGISPTGTHFEFHRRLWPESEGERVEILNSLGLTEPATFRDIQVDGCNTKTLGYTEHLTYLIIHAVKHFSVAGIGIRHLLDLSFYVNAYFGQIDWKRFWSDLKRLNYQKITETMFTACIRYLSMNEGALPKEKFSDDADWIIEDSFEAGVFGNKLKERWKTTDVIKPYYLDENKKIPKTRLGIVLKFMFPDKKSVHDRGLSTEGSLPANWFRRWKSMFAKWKHDDKRVGVFKRAGIARKRMKMLQDLGIMKNR